MGGEDNIGEEELAAMEEHDLGALCGDGGWSNVPSENIGGGQSSGDSPVPETEDGEEEETVEEVKPKRVHRPQDPTDEMIREHHLTGHAVYRSWCQFCVAGRANENPHSHPRRDEEIQVPQHHMDFCFLRNQGEEQALPNRKEISHG